MTHMIKPFTLTRTTYTFLFATASLCLAVLITINVPPFIGMPVEAKELAVFPAPIALPAEDLAAKAAVLYDPTTGQILFAKNAPEPLALASLTKLMTAQTILAQTSERQIVTITSQNLRPEGDWGLRPGEMWSVEQLLRFGLVASANDAMAAAADSVGPTIIDEMNRTAKVLGLSQTHFSNPTGLDLDLETAGAYGSAYDVALLVTSFMQRYPTLFGATAKPSVTITSGDVLLNATSTDTPLLDIPGLVGAKTGYTDLAGGNLIAVFDIEIGHPLIAVVLGSTREKRFEDIRALVVAVRSNGK